MSADGSITMFWADQEYQFRLAIGQFRELQEAVNGRRIAIGAPTVGPATLLNLFKNNDAWPDDVRDVIRLGHIGAGMPPQVAFRKMASHFDNSPLLEHMKPAYMIILSALVGPLDDQLSKKKTVTTETSPSSSPPSTEQALQ
jgi:hypothetical protein